SPERSARRLRLCRATGADGRIPLGMKLRQDSLVLPPLFTLLFCCILLTTSKEQPWADARPIYQTTQALVERHSFAIPEGQGHWYMPRDGKFYTMCPLGMVFALIPSYLLARAVEHRLPGSPVLVNFARHLSPSLIGAAIGMLFCMALRRMGTPLRLAV